MAFSLRTVWVSIDRLKRLIKDDLEAKKGLMEYWKKDMKIAYWNIMIGALWSLGMSGIGIYFMSPPSQMFQVIPAMIIVVMMKRKNKARVDYKSYKRKYEKMKLDMLFNGWRSGEKHI